MNRLRFSLLLTTSLAAAAFACGGISDPTLGGTENVATISGALTGTSVPANARVALVYRKVTTSSTGSVASVEVGSDVAVVGGKFTMNLGLPAADYFAAIDGHSIKAVADSDSTPPSVGSSTPDPAPPAGGTSSSGAAGSGVSTKLAPRELVGGQITEPITAAMAGFVVYADTNGNGKLDLEGQYASTPDQILGGNKELVLVYLKGGGTLDYEKLRDRSGILPATGFNLSWTEGRWLPLNVVELQLSSTAQLPSPVCASSYGYGSGSGGSSGSSGSGEPFAEETPVPSTADASAGNSSSSSGGGGSSGTGSSGGSTGAWYPAAGSVGLVCSADGRSFTYDAGASCPPPTPAPVGLCVGSGYDATTCAGVRYSTSLNAGDPVPANWPCTVAPDAIDGGPAPDSGAVDAGAGG